LKKFKPPFCFFYYVFWRGRFIFLRNNIFWVFSADIFGKYRRVYKKIWGKFTRTKLKCTAKREEKRNRYNKRANYADYYAKYSADRKPQKEIRRFFYLVSFRFFCFSNYFRNYF